jgi:hypothetical protein
MSSKNYQLSVVMAPTQSPTVSAPAATEAAAPVSSATAVHTLPAGRAQALKVAAVPGARYLVTDTDSGRAPQQLHARRRGKDLLIHLDEFQPEQPDLIIENFYNSLPGTFAGMAEDELTYPFIPNTAAEADDIVALADGAAISQILGSTQVGALGAAGAAGGVVAGGAVVGGGVGAGGVAAGGLAAAGLGAAGGGGGGSSASTAVALTAVLSQNRDAIDANKDANLNSAEGRDGITYTLALSSQPDRALQVSDLVITGGTLKDGSFAPSASNPLRYTFVVNPDPDKQDGQLKVSLKAGVVKSTSGQANSAAEASLISYDTQAMSSTWSNNFKELGSVTGGKDDNTLNSAEALQGLRYTVSFSEVPKPTLDASYFSVGADSLRAGSLITSSDGKSVSFVVDPLPGQAGKVSVGWTSKASSLTDQAGNPILNASLAPAADVSYDLRLPSLNVQGTADGRLTTTGNGDLTVALDETGASLDPAQSRMTLLDGTLGRPGQTTPLVISRSVLDKLADGFYTLSFDLQDINGNRATIHQVLEVDRNQNLTDAWSDTKATQTGTDANDRFIDRKGSNIYDGAGAGSDRFSWIRAYAGDQAGSNTDTVKNFNIGSQTGVHDTIDLLDLLGGGPNADGSNLGRYLRVMQVDTNNNGDVDETRLYINRLGQLEDQSSDLAALNQTALQVIVLEGINRPLSELVANDNLIWQTPVI